MCILARDMRLTGAKAAGKRTARPATFPLDPRTAPPRIWRLLSNVPHGSHPIRVAAWHLAEGRDAWRPRGQGLRS